MRISFSGFVFETGRTIEQSVRLLLSLACLFKGFLLFQGFWLVQRTDSLSTRLLLERIGATMGDYYLYLSLYFFLGLWVTIFGAWLFIEFWKNQNTPPVKA